MKLYIPMTDRVRRKIEYWQVIHGRRKAAHSFCKSHQVKLYNWSYPFPQDLWLIDFIEQRGLLNNKPKTKIGLYSIFAPFWLSYLDGCDARIFVERENLHKPSMQGWLHRFLDDNRIDLSLGFDELQHPQYMRFPFWLMWNVFPATATYEDVRLQVAYMNSPKNHSYIDRYFCTFVCSHDDLGRRQMYENLSKIGAVHCPGRLFHNNDDLKEKYGDDKLELLKHYRFNLTPENTNHEGYVTEKLFEAINSGCVPIYHGSNNHPEPDVLNQEAIIFVEMGKDNHNALELIAELNSNEKKYMDFACQPRFVDGAEDVIWNYYETLEEKLKEIIRNT